MEALLKRDINFLRLSGMRRPDFNTINLFRWDRLADVIDDIFTQVVLMPVEAKFVSLELQYIDGTKIEAGGRHTRGRARPLAMRHPGGTGGRAL